MKPVPYPFHGPSQASPPSVVPSAPRAALVHSDEFLREIAALEPEAALQKLRSSSKGLTDDEVRFRLSRYGPNEVGQEEDVSWLLRLLQAFKNPLILLLTAIAGFSFATDDPAGGFIVGSMVMLSVFLTAFQEYRSNAAAKRLMEMVTTTVAVTRRTEEVYSSGERPFVVVKTEKIERPISQLVPGDVISLSSGDMVPADILLLSTKDLFLNQASLTGEALPVEKAAGAVPQGGQPLDLANFAFMGSNIVSGTAQAVVVNTGASTYFGKVAKSLSGNRQLSSFEIGMGRFVNTLLVFMAVMVPIVLLINGLGKHDWSGAFLFSVAVAVGLTPEMLPMIVTSNLARGALAMSRKKVIVKRLNSIQNFGAMDVLCTDKTGTLTQDKVALLKYVDVSGFKSEKVLQYGYLNSYFQTGLKNLLDVAVLDRKESVASLQVESRYKKIDEIPFDFSRRRMSVVVEEGGGRRLLVCKGALEEIFESCDKAESDGESTGMEQGLTESLRQVSADLNEDGLRVIAVAYKEVPAGQPIFSVKDEAGLTLLGYLAFLDPPKESAGQAIALLGQIGVKVKVLTGDNDRVALKVCREVGISTETIVLGAELEKMDEAALGQIVDKADIFAKLNPSQKERVIRALKAKGHVVGFMGDGINDAPALRAADVGISVDNAVDIAKESADIILLEKSLLVLEEGVLEGRRVFGNIIKYIRMGASSNFGNVFSVIGASLLLPFLPMLPLQMLAQNLLYDISQTGIPFDGVDPEYLTKPRKWEISGVVRYMLFLGPVSSLFDYATFALLWFVIKANTGGMQGVFQSGWFVEGLLSQTLVVHVIRTDRIPFIGSRAAWPLMVTTFGIMALGLWLPFSPLAPHLGFQALPHVYFGWLALILVSYCLLAGLAKVWFVRRFER